MYVLRTYHIYTWTCMYVYVTTYIRTYMDTHVYMIACTRIHTVNMPLTACVGMYIWDRDKEYLIISTQGVKWDIVYRRTYILTTWRYALHPYVYPHW